jgi:hypothetical protein
MARNSHAQYLLMLAIQLPIVEYGNTYLHAEALSLLS